MWFHVIPIVQHSAEDLLGAELWPLSYFWAGISTTWAPAMPEHILHTWLVVKIPNRKQTNKYF